MVTFLAAPLLRKWRYWVLPLWFGLSLIAVCLEAFHGKINNYIIFKHVFLHVKEQLPLYVAYPEAYFDVNLYGPIFSLVIAPFSVFPDTVGAILWGMANALFLYVAVRQLPLTKTQQYLILLFSANELMGASSYFQFNTAIAACILLTYACIHKGKDVWAAFFVVLGTFTKLYGIVGLAFFFFSEHKVKFLISVLLWSVLFFVLPMLISSPSYIIGSYVEWFESLSHKHANNVQFQQGVLLQDISAGGFIRRVLHWPEMKNIYVFGPAVVLFLSQYIWLKYRRNRYYQLYILCTTLLFPVLFSSSSEACTYIIAFPAVCIWYVAAAPLQWRHILFGCIVVVCSFSHSDLFTPWVRQNIAVPYAIKAFPCLVLWLLIIYQVLTRHFLREPGVAVELGADRLPGED